MLSRFRHRSIAFDMLAVFGIILAMFATAALLVRNLSTGLTADARDAVWEASVPPTFVFAVSDMLWRNHQDSARALIDPDAAATAGAGMTARAEAALAKWRELLALAPYFPAEIRAKVEGVDRNVSAFRRMTEASVDLAGQNASADARMAQLAKQADAMASLAGEIETMLGLMRARIQSVNARMEATAHSALMTLAAIAGVILLLLVASVGILQRRIISPIARATGAMTALSGGRLDVDIPETKRIDEIGRMTETIRDFRASLQETEALRAQQEAERLEAEARRKAEMAQLAERFEAHVGRVVQSVTGAVSLLEQAAEDMSRETGAATGEATAVAAASEEATENVRAVADATNELSGAMNVVGSQIAQSGERIRQVAEQARQTDRDVKLLGSAADSIGTVAKVISDIAGQTNLLALNATIEAARAGEAGRGFAVVAQEVKELAAQTSKATEEIAGQIAAIQAASAKAIDAMQAIAETIGEVSEISEVIGVSIGQQMTTTGMIAENINEAAKGTVEVTRNISNVSVAIRNSGDLVAAVLNSSRDLGREGQALAGEVEEFLGSIRAA